MSKEPEIQKAKLNLEAAQVAWAELQRFFAQGAVIWVDESLDLIDVAHCIAQDDSKAIRHWMRGEVLSQVSDEQAKKWLSEEAWLWSVVVRPLVLVQQIKSAHS
jgi:hypothetical protein